jgi:hypothetical protein
MAGLPREKFFADGRKKPHGRRSEGLCTLLIKTLELGQ